TRSTPRQQLRLGEVRSEAAGDRSAHGDRAFDLSHARMRTTPRCSACGHLTAAHRRSAHLSNPRMANFQGHRCPARLPNLKTFSNTQADCAPELVPVCRARFRSM